MPGDQMAAIVPLEDLAQDDWRNHDGRDVLPEELLRPVIAGAFARGIAETFALLGMPALFLDREGRVLLVNEWAKPMLGAGLQIRAGHLLARARKDNRSLAEFMSSALQDPAQRPSVRLEVAGLGLRALPVPGHAQHIDQLAHVVVLLG